MKSRSLPRNISWTPLGYTVRVMRGGVSYEAFISHRHGDGLARAVAARDRFWRIVGEVANLHRVAGRSNTGIAGISDTTDWWRSKPRDCFTVSWYDASRCPRRRRFYYGAFRPRSVAFSAAKAFRQRVARVVLPEAGHITNHN